MTWRCCGTAGWASCSPGSTHRRRWDRSCGASGSGTSASSTRSPPGSSRNWPSTPTSSAADVVHVDPGFAFVDVDDTVVGVHGHAKQGAGFGYNQIRGLNALLATVTVAGAAPVIVAQRLRKGSCASARGAKRLVADAVKTTCRLLQPGTPVLVRMDSAFYGRHAVHAALAGGAQVSVTTRMDARVKAAIASIPTIAWTAIEYTDAVFDEHLWAVDLPGRGRRDRVRRVRRSTQARPGAGSADRAADPRLPRRQAPSRRAGRPVRRVAVPRVLHHHRPRPCSTP